MLNDLDTAYLLLPLDDTRAQKPWIGGLNMTALRMLEQRAYGSYHFMLNTTPSGINPAHIVLNYTTSGTRHGLSKMPYVRDSRRAIGVDRFRLMYPGMDYYNASQPSLGFHYNDCEFRLSVSSLCLPLSLSPSFTPFSVSLSPPLSPPSAPFPPRFLGQQLHCTTTTTTFTTCAQ